MSDPFDRITGDFHLDLDTQGEINHAAAMHASYYHRLTMVHKLPEQIAGGMTESFIQAAVVQPDED